MMPIPPSGRQHHLRHGSRRATVTEVGGTLRTLARDEWEVIDGFEEDEICPAANGAVLAPWPNRLEDGRYQFEGQDYQLPLSEPKRGNAIHGLVRWLAFETRAASADHVALGVLLHPRPGYPFALDLEVSYRLDQEGLSVTTTAGNAGAKGLPFGLGHHPYLRVGTPLIDQAWLQFDARTLLELDQRQNATGRRLPVAGTEYDFRSGRTIGPARLDTAYTDLSRDREGRARIELRSPDTGRRITLWMDRAYGYLMAFTADTLAGPRRRRGLALEPMTCAPNAFRHPRLGLTTLAPGERASCSWGLIF
jgi:aldose 1-epimerase